jgi:putative transposase
MKSNYFRIGEPILRQGAPYFIAAFVQDGSHVQLSHAKTGALTTVRLSKLLGEYSKKQVRFGHSYLEELASRDEPLAETTYKRSLKDLPEVARGRTLRRRKYLQELHKRGALRFGSGDELERQIKQISETLGDPRPPSRSTVWRWNQNWVRQSRRIDRVVDRCDRRGGKDLGRLSEEIEELMVTVIDEFYLTEQRHTAGEAYQNLLGRIALLNKQRSDDEQLKEPSASTWLRRLKRLNAYEVMARRDGERSAKKFFRAVTGTVKVSRILERVEMDHTPLNLFVIDNRTYMPLGRPDLTVALCRKSRCVVGYWVSFTGHGADAVLGCLRHVVQPKSYIEEKYPAIQLDWPCFGIPIAIYVDNGMEFVGDDMAAACSDLGIDIFYLPARRPQWKGAVERFLKTFNHSLIHTIPGTTFEKITARKDYNPTKHALITLEDLERIIHMWVCDVYHNKVHRGLKARPIDVWERDAAIEPVPMLDDLGRLDFILGEGVERTLFHYGVELHGGQQRFNSKALALVFSACGNVRVRVKFHRSDISKVWVEHPATKDYIEVPNIDQEYSRGLTLEQHQFIQARAKVDAEGRVDRDALFAAKAGIQGEIQRLMDSKLMRDRKRGARLSGQNSGQVRDSQGSDLRAQYYDEQQREAAARKAAARRARAERKNPMTGTGPKRPPQATEPAPAARPRFTRRAQGGGK